MEEWKDIKQTNGQYQISSEGRVRRLWRETKSGKFYQEKIIATTPIYNGYLHVQIYINKKCKGLFVHRLVAEAFIKNPHNYPEINHIDCNKQNNRVENLEWCTRKHNMQEAGKNGLISGGQAFNKKYPHYVLQIAMDGTPIRSFWSAHEANAYTGVYFSAIRDIVRKNSCENQRGGYLWRACSQEEYEKYKNGPIQKAIEHNNGRRKISAISDEGEIVATYENVMAAARAINSTPGSIRFSIKKHRRHHGYHWNYTNEI